MFAELSSLDQLVFEEAGVVAVAPLLYSFVHWLHLAARRDGITKLLFLARDGYLLQQAYRAVIPAEEQVAHHYMYASRRLFNLAAIRELDEPALKFLIGDRVEMPVANYLRRAGLAPDECRAAIVAAGFADDQTVVAAHDRGRLRQLILSLEKPVLAVAAAERCRLKAYADTLVDWDLDRCAVVDVGWHGSLQGSLAGVLGLPPASLQGYYVGLHFGAHKRGGVPREAFLDESKPNDFWLYQKTIRRCVEFFELCLSESAGSIYGLRQQGAAFVPLREGQSAAPAVTTGLQALQAAAVAALASQPADQTRQQAWRGVERLLSHPTLDQARCFGDIVHQEGFGGAGRLQQLAAPRYTLAGYVRHPLLFMTDWRGAFWRRGFTARL